MTWFWQTCFLSARNWVALWLVPLPWELALIDFFFFFFVQITALQGLVFLAKIRLNPTAVGGGIFTWAVQFLHFYPEHLCPFCMVLMAFLKVFFPDGRSLLLILLRDLLLVFLWRCVQLGLIKRSFYSVWTSQP